MYPALTSQPHVFSLNLSTSTPWNLQIHNRHVITWFSSTCNHLIFWAVQKVSQPFIHDIFVAEKYPRNMSRVSRLYSPVAFPQGNIYIYMCVCVCVFVCMYASMSINVHMYVCMLEQFIQFYHGRTQSALIQRWQHKARDRGFEFPWGKENLSVGNPA